MSGQWVSIELRCGKKRSVLLHFIFPASVGGPVLPRGLFLATVPFAYVRA